jgi:hypothetical protein
MLFSATVLTAFRVALLFLEYIGICFRWRRHIHYPTETFGRSSSLSY